MGDADPATQLGTVVAGKYELVRVLGAGGAGAVYEARHRETGGRYALKRIHPDGGPDDEARLLREARALARLSHPNIVRLVDFDRCDGGVFLVEEILEGITLRALLDEELVLSPERTLTLLLPVLRALGHAHARGVVHRDVKPENIILSGEDGGLRARLIDFGLARTPDAPPGLTPRGALTGTPRYMSPEQAWGRDDVDARSDLWSFGVVLYECLSGFPPHAGPNVRAVIASIVTHDPPHLRTAAVGVDDALADAVMLALVRAPEARCPTAAALERALTGETLAPTTAPPPAPPALATPPRWRVGAALAAGVALTVAFAALAPRLQQPAPRGREAPFARPPPARTIPSAPVTARPPPDVPPAAPSVVPMRTVPDVPRRPQRSPRTRSVPHGANAAPIVEDL